MNNPGYKVLIVGCGQLGSRHLQAIASLPSVSDIEVLDPNPEALNLGRTRMQEISQLVTPPNVKWITSINEATELGNLCVIATQAKGRCTLLRNLSDTLGYTSFLLEKIADQSMAAIDDTVAYCRSLGISTWVNFQTRAVPTYQRVKQKLSGTDPIYFSGMGGLQFLATNAIHTADLFAFYDDCNHIEHTTSEIDQVLHPSKRGKDVFDLTGTIHGYTKKGSSLTLSYGQSNQPWEHFTISSSKYRCIIDPLQGWIMEAGSDSDWGWKTVPFEGSVLVSETTKTIANDIMQFGKSKVPTLEESLVSHRFILDELLPHFRKLTGLTLEYCPVT